jgi:hypothetical protein
MVPAASLWLKPVLSRRDLGCTYKTKRTPSCNPISEENPLFFYAIFCAKNLAFCDETTPSAALQSTNICLLVKRNEFDIPADFRMRRRLFGSPS